MKVSQIKRSYVIIPAIAVFVSFLTKYYVGFGMDWYRTLVRPEVEPEKWVFGFVWSALYLLATFSAIIAWSHIKKKDQRNRAMYLFGFLALLNIAWTYQFFVQHEIRMSLYTAIAIEVVLCALIYLLWQPAKQAAKLLIPFAVWLLFDIYLIMQVIELNPFYS